MIEDETAAALDDSVPPWERLASVAEPAAPPIPETLHISGTGIWKVSGFDPWHGTLDGTISGPHVRVFLSAVLADDLWNVAIQVFLAYDRRMHPEAGIFGTQVRKQPLPELDATSVEITYTDPESGHWSGVVAYRCEDAAAGRSAA